MPQHRITPQMKEARARASRNVVANSMLPQIAAEALDALASLFEVGVLGGVGNPDRRSKSERRALHHGDSLVLQKLRDEVLVIGEQLARRRFLADRTRT